MLQCGTCGYQNPDGQAFCVRCAAVLDARCPACGKLVPATSRTCDHCGVRMDAVLSPPSFALPDSRVRQTLRTLMPDALAAKIGTAQIAGERREVTALSVGFDVGQQALDSEALYVLMDRVIRCLASIVYEYEGTIDRYTNGELTAMFGLPVTHENDPERAVHAALDMQTALCALQPQIGPEQRTDVAIRIGVHTGLVIAGSVGSDLHVEYTVVGDTIRLAQRLQAAAEPNAVLVSFDTYQRARPWFRFEPLPPVSVESSHPLSVFRPLEPLNRSGRTRGLPALQVPMIGRQDDLDTLHGTLREVREQGQSRIVLITGEAGIGKTRLLAEFRNGLSQSGTYLCQGSCLTYARSKPLQLAADALRDLLGLAETDPAERQREALQAHVERLGLTDGDLLPYLYTVLGLEQHDPRVQARMTHLDNDVLQKMTHSALQQVFVAAATRVPTALVFEDLHWIDGASLDFLGHLIQTVSDVPLMIILMSRDGDPQDTIQSLVTAADRRDDRLITIALSPLAPADCSRLVEQLVPSDDERVLAIKERIAKRVGGNPFYAEEIVRGLVDQGELTYQDGVWNAAPGAADLVEKIPGTLNSLIMARFDRLDAGPKQTLLKAVVLGLSFPAALLESLEGVHRSDIEALKSQQFLALVSTGQQEAWAFRHALIQDTVYRTLLRRDRQRFHEQAAQAIEQGEFWLPDQRTEALAYHYVNSAQPPKAIPYLVDAAENAARRCAYESAIARYRQVVDLVQDADGQDELYLRVQIGLARALRFVGEYEQAGEIMEQALHSLLLLSVKVESVSLLPSLVRGMRELADIRQREGDPEEAMRLLQASLDAQGEQYDQAHVQLWRSVVDRMAWVRFRQGNLNEAFALASAATLGVDLETDDDPITLASLYNTLGGILWQQGDLPEAADYVDRSLRLYEGLGYLWGMANAHTNLGSLNYVMGNWARAEADMSRADALQRQIGDLENRAITLNNLGTLHQSAGQHEAAQRDLEEALLIRQRLGSAWGIAWAHVSLARLAVMRGQFPKALAHVETALNTSQNLGPYEIEARWVRALAQAEDDLEQGIETAEQALEMARSARLIEQAADCRRALGILYGRAGDVARAESHLRESIDLCAKSNAPYGRGLALLALGNLYHDSVQVDDLDVREKSARALDTLRDAETAFERLGASHDLDITRQCIDRLVSEAPAEWMLGDLKAAPVDGEGSGIGAGLPEGEWRTVTIVHLYLEPSPDVDEESLFETMSTVMPSLVALAGEQHGQTVRRQDGLTVVFGAPTAYEDDAERAVLTAWRMIQYLQAAEQETIPLAFGAAVSQGSAIAGQIGPRFHTEFAVEGAPMREARVIAASVPSGSVWVTEAVRAATDRICLYDLAGLDVWALAGFREQAYPARGLTGISARLIGRDAPLQEMMALSENLARGLGGLILIEGEPGVGKSRLMREFAETVRSTDTLIWSGRCTPQRSGYAFSLFSDLVAQALDVRPTDTPAQIVSKVDAAFQAWPRNTQVTRPYLEILLGIPPSGERGERLARLEPEQLRQQIFVSLRRLFKGVAGQTSMVVMLDDLHWVDPISAELLQFLTTIVVSDPILFVCAQRRQGSDSPNDRLVRLQGLIPTQTNRIRLERLSADESELLLDELLPQVELPEHLRRSILARSEGNPYFVEEFVRMLIERGYLQQRQDGWEIEPELAPSHVLLPASLEKLIRSRLDILPIELRTIIQHAAVIGAPFDVDLLQATSGMSDVLTALDRLASRLLVRRGEDNQWLFHHSLIQSVAYNSLLRTRRRALHLQVGEALEARWADAQAEHAEDLAYHFVRADAGTRALPYLVLAGERAANRYANEEAKAHFEQAIQLLSIEREAAHDLGWRVVVGLGDVYRRMGDYANAVVICRAGLVLADTWALSSLAQASLYQRLGHVAKLQGELDLSQRHLDKAQRVLGDPATPEEKTEAARITTGQAWVHFLQGRFDQARHACEVSLDYARSAQIPQSLSEEAFTENMMGGVYYRLGELELAMRHTQRAMDLREQMGYTWGVASTLGNLGILAFTAGEWDRAHSFFERSLTLRREIGDVQGMVLSSNNLGIVARDQGKLDMAEERFLESLSIATPFEIGFHVANSTMELARVQLLRGRVDAAQRSVDQARRQAQEIGAKDMLAELRCIQAQILLASAEWTQARAAAQESATMFAEMGNRNMEASAWRILSEIALGQDDPRAARQALDRAQQALADGTDRLEQGRIAAQAGSIDLAQRAFVRAEKNLRSARETFAQLGASLDLARVEEALEQLA